MNWFASLPPADAVVPCGSGTHTVRWEAGQLTLPAHPDAEAELVLGALGGDKPGCVTVAETWARHTADVAVLGVAPRCAADEVSVSWDDVAQLRDGVPPGLAQTGQMTATSTAGTRVARRVLGSAGLSARGLATASGMAENLRRQVQRIELFELLALGTALQFRLSGTVCAAWAEPAKSEERAGRRPELAAALTGRFAPAAQEWLGIDPDAVTVTLHEGPGWGTMRLTGADQARRLHASLPVGWLASVWACGLAVVDGHLVVAVEQPGYPEARVLALPSPDAAPVPTTVQAKPDGLAGLPRWELASRP